MLKAEAKKKEKAMPCLDMKGSLYLVSSSPLSVTTPLKPGTTCKKRGGQQAKWPSHDAGVRYKTGVWNLCHPILSWHRGPSAAESQTHHFTSPLSVGISELFVLSVYFVWHFWKQKNSKKKKKNLLKITVRNQEMGPSGGEGRKGMRVFNLCLQCLCGTCPWHSMVKRQSETLPSSRKAFTCHPGDAGQGVNPKHTGRRKTAGSVPGVFTGLSASSISVAPDSSGNLDLPQPELQLNPSVCLLQLKIVLPKSAWHFLCRQSSRI